MLAAWLALPFVLAAAGEYNESRAIEYAKLAGAAYCAPQTLSAWSCGSKCFPGVTSVKTCSVSGVLAFLGRWDGRCLVSFEGTNGAESVEIDAEVLKKPFARGMVHYGFLSTWYALKPCIRQSLDQIGCGTSTPLRATGHSLGAAVVVLAMTDLANQGQKVEEIYNFGMPRVGNSDFAYGFEQLFNGHFFRVTHGQDPFVDLPPSSYYVHVEPEVFYRGTNKDGYVICTEEFDKSCSAQFFPEGFKVAYDSAAVAWHHKYMDIDTTQAGCEATAECVEGEIETSWCAYGIPCNTDVRGKEVHCNFGDIWKGGYGKCECNQGYCALAGKCRPEEQQLATIAAVGNVSTPEAFSASAAATTVAHDSGDSIRVAARAGLPVSLLFSAAAGLMAFGLAASLAWFAMLRRNARNPELREGFILA